MFTSLMYLAMNPNLTTEQVLEHSRRLIESRRKLLEDTLDRIEQADVAPAVKLEMLTKLMPILLALP